ncbi:AAA family ATPase [Aquitalea sp.]|uniref:AAA family ATPase n=1 Tax=Aquitalea sp. TaxID=1872623 RepID=UPI00258708B7|nr:AAA family ATPase [Aquitalea sp.]
MPQQELKEIIAAADHAINREDFDELMAFYASDAVLVVQPGMLARGGEQIRAVFPAIAQYFNHTLQVSQADMQVVAGGDTALVLARTELQAEREAGQAWQATRFATYVFRRDPAGVWRCAIDNSYGTSLIEMPPSLHLLCGKICSGKSTLARKLAKEPKTVLISEDEWLARLYPDAIKEVVDYVRCSGLLKDVLGGHVEELLQAGLSVVLDVPANTVASRQWAMSVCTRAGVAHSLHLLDVPDSLCKERLHLRNQSGTHPFTVDDVTFERISRYYEPPREDECLNVIHH